MISQLNTIFSNSVHNFCLTAKEVFGQVVIAALEKRKKDGAPPGEYLFIDALLDSGLPDDVIYADALGYLIGGFHTTGLGEY